MLKYGNELAFNSRFIYISESCLDRYFLRLILNLKNLYHETQAL